eukprot:1633860-Prymnesium_polylepis.1
MVAVRSAAAVLLRPSLARVARVSAARALLDVPTALIAADAVADAGPSISLDALSGDIFTFLVASVAVVPLSLALNVPSVLGFLVVGCAFGPYGLGFFSNSEADLQLGDFGI